jgi:hypothetical protein
MKNLIILIVTAITAILIFSCIPFGEPVTCIEGTNTTINLYNWSTDTIDEDIPVCTVKESTYANFMMLEDSLSLLNVNQVNTFATEFDSTIYPTMTSRFGPLESDVDGNGKVNIVMYDIEYYVDDVEIRGYVNSDDMDDSYDPELEGNDGEYFYIDVTSAFLNEDKIKSSMAHEFQHVINQSVQLANGNLNPMEVWLDEGLAMAAEHLIYGAGMVEERVNNFNDSEDIRHGESALLIWDPANAIPNYALSYLFVQWISQNYSEDLYDDIIDQTTGTVQNVITATGATNFEQLLTNWAIDNMIDPTYGGRLSVAVDVKAPLESISTLLPGAVVYDPVNDCTDCSTTGAGSNITMIGIDSSGTIYDVNEGDMSMVFNHNPDEDGDPEDIGNWYGFGAEPPVTSDIDNYTEEEIKLMNSFNPRVPKRP